MFKLLWICLQIRFSIAANRLIHFLRHIPGLKHIIPVSIYQKYTLKIAFSVFATLFITIKKILCRLLYVGVVALLGIILYQCTVIGHSLFDLGPMLFEQSFTQMTAKQVLLYILNLWFFFCLFGAGTSARVINASPHDEIMINYLRTNPASYAKSCILFVHMTDLILYLPYFFVVCVMTGSSLWILSTLSVVFITLRLLGEVLNLLLFHIGKSGKNFFISILTSLFALFCIIVIPVWLGVPDWMAILQSPYTALISVMIGIAAAIYIVCYPQYHALIKMSIADAMMSMEKAQEIKKTQRNSSLLDAKNWSKNIQEKDLKLGEHENKMGFSYLNAIFFERHNKFFRKKLLFRNLTILLICVIITLLSIGYTLYSGKPAITYFQDAQDIEMFLNKVPLFFFIIYFISMGRVVTASIFTNCDIQMLHYPYYRLKENIFASFKARFLYIIRCNFQITSILAVGVIVALRFFFGSMDYLYAGVFFLLLTCIGFFFAFNDLFLYYVIQPYDSAGQTKSIIYSIINGVIYFISYMNMNLDFDFMTYSVFIIVVTVLYFGVGMGLLLLFAPNNFKLR